MAHWQLPTLMGTGWVPHKGGHGSPNMVDDSTVVSYQLIDAVYQSMDNLALMGPLFHPLTESHVQASMEVEEKVSPTASLQIE